MSNLSDLLPAGASGKKATFTASGTISNGDTVILNSDGTVTAISATALSEGFNGSAVVFDAEAISTMENMGPTAAFDGNGTVVCIYSTGGGSAMGTAVAGTVSGSSITFGTPVVFASTVTYAKGIAYVPAEDRFAICYQNNSSSNQGFGIVAEVSGTSLTFGTAVMFAGGNSIAEVYVCTGPSRKVGVSFKNTSLSGHGYALQGTVTASTNTIQFGGQNQLTANSVGWPSIAYDPVNDRYVFAYYGASGYGVTRTGTPSGTDSAPTISFSGTENTFNSALTFYTQVVYDPDSGNLLIAYNDFGGLQRGEAIVVYVSGNNIVTGSTTEFETGITNYIKLCYAGKTGKFFAAYIDNSNGNRLTYAIGTVNGTASTWATPVVYGTATTSAVIQCARDSYNNRVALLYQDTTNSFYGTANVFNLQTTNLTTANFLGIADAAISNAASGDIVLKGGISENATSVVTTTNSTVYVQGDGTLSTTVSSVEAGLAFGAFSGTVGYNISNADYDSVSFDLSSQDATPSEIVFNSDGTKMFIAGQTNSSIFQYSLTTAYDLSTASYDSVSFSVAGQASTPRGLCFSPSGTKMLVIASDTDTIYQYSLSTGFNLSTASYDSVSLSVASQETNPQAVQFNGDGTSLYFAGTNTNTIYQYDMSSAYDLSTASYSSKSFSVSSQDTSTQGLFFRPDGLRFFVCGVVSDSIYQYSLATAFDISTASYDSVSFSVFGQDNTPLGVTFNSDGTKMYMVGNNTDAAYQYSTTLNTTSKLLLNG